MSNPSAQLQRILTLIETTEDYLLTCAAEGQEHLREGNGFPPGVRVELTRLSRRIIRLHTMRDRYAQEHGIPICANHSCGRPLEDRDPALHDTPFCSFSCRSLVEDEQKVLLTLQQPWDTIV